VRAARRLWHQAPLLLRSSTASSAYPDAAACHADDWRLLGFWLDCHSRALPSGLGWVGLLVERMFADGWAARQALAAETAARRAPRPARAPRRGGPRAEQRAAARAQGKPAAAGGWAGRGARAARRERGARDARRERGGATPIDFFFKRKIQSSLPDRARGMAGTVKVAAGGAKAAAGGAAAPRARGGAAAAAAAAARALLLGWSRADALRAATMFTGLVILLPVVFAPQDWDAYSALGSSCAIYMYGMLCPHFSGEAVIVTALVLVALPLNGAAMSALFGIRAAISSSGAPDAAGAAAVAVLATLAAAAMHVARARFPLLFMPLRVTICLVGLAAFGAFWAPVTAETFIGLWTTLGYVALGIAMGVPVTLFIVPAPAGRAARRALRGVLRELAAEGAAVAELLAELPPPGGGREGRVVGVAAELEGAALPIYARHEALGAVRAKLDTLLKLVSFEIDVYRRPRAFPAAAFKATYAHGTRGEVATFLLLAAAQGGRAPPPAPALVAPLRALAAATAALAAALGDAVADDAPFGAVVAAAAGVEAAAEGAGAALEALEPAPDRAQRWYVEMSLYAALQMWRAAAAAAGAVAATQAGAPAAAASHFGDGALRGALAARPAQGERAAPAELRPLAADLRRAAARLAASAGSAAPAAGAADAVAVAAPAGGRARRALFAAAERTGVRGWMLGLGAQALVDFGVAAAICVVGTADGGPFGFAFWVWIAVSMLSDISIGNCFSRAWQRLAGTFAGIAWCCPTMAVALAPTGESLPISVGGRAAAAAMVAAWMTAVAALQSRWAPRGQYACAMAMFTVPLLVIPILATGGRYTLDESEPWQTLGFRATATVIGVVLDSLVALIVFRVTARDHLRNAAAAALAELAVIAEAVAARLAAPGAPDPAAGAALEAHASAARARLAEVFALRSLAKSEARLGVSRLDPAAVSLLTHRLRDKWVRWLGAAQDREAATDWVPAPELAARVVALGAQEAAALRALRLVILNAAPLSEALRTTAALLRAVAALADDLGAAGGAREGYVLGALFAAAGDMALLIRAAARPLLPAADAALADDAAGAWAWHPLVSGGVAGNGALVPLEAGDEAPAA
jgi:hypothetical protein